MLNGAEIARRRNALGLTLRDAAERAGWGSVQGFARWNRLELGKVDNPELKTLLAVAKVLGCRVEDIIVQPRKAKPARPRPHA